MLTKFYLIAIPLVLASTSDVIGLTYTSSMKQKGTSAVTYKQASVGSYTLDSSVEWVSPRIVHDLSLSAPEPSKVEAAEAVPSQTNYYDGSSNVKASGLQCRILVSSSSCLASTSCGWCKATETCIPGTPTSPLVTCPQNSYVYQE